MHANSTISVFLMGAYRQIKYTVDAHRDKYACACMSDCQSGSEHTSGTKTQNDIKLQSYLTADNVVTFIKYLTVVLLCQL